MQSSLFKLITGLHLVVRMLNWDLAAYTKRLETNANRWALLVLRLLLLSESEGD